MNHKELTVWKVSMELIVDTYNFTGTLPKKELYGFTSQMNRCALSISSNIAEGAARGTTKDYIRFLYNSMSSATELETQYLATQMIPIAKENIQLHEKIISVIKMLYNLIRSLKRKISPQFPSMLNSKFNS